jgi:hypothetical protein
MVALSFGPHRRGTLSPESHLGGVVVSVLATGPKGHKFEPSQGDGFLGAIKIRSKPTFG